MVKTEKLILEKKGFIQFPSIGIPNLKDYFKQIESGKADIDLLKQKLMVAHSRAMIRYRQKEHHVNIMLPNTTQYYED